MKRALVFLAITFGITYAYDFLVVYPIAQGTAPYASEFLSPDLAYMVSVALTMLFPALGVVLTRLVTREGFQMCAWCTVLAIFLSYVTIRTGSTFAAAIGHGAVNGTTNGVTLFSLSGGNPFVGPLCTGIVGGLPLLAVAAIMLWDMRRREKAGTLRMPEAGLPDGPHPDHRERDGHRSTLLPRWRILGARQTGKGERAMTELLCVGAGGALGAMGRYGLGLIPLGSELPLMTLLINFLGSVAIGAIVETSELAAGALSREAVLFLKVGLCGGFTTFSTFSLETLELIEGGQYAIAGAYALVSVVLCVAGVLVGKVLARALMPTG